MEAVFGLISDIIAYGSDLNITSPFSLFIAYLYNVPGSIPSINALQIPPFESLVILYSSLIWKSFLSHTTHTFFALGAQVENLTPCLLFSVTT